MKLIPARHSHDRQQAGLSLVELMVALVIASLLMLGIGSIYLSSSQTYRVQDNLSRMQEVGRYASDQLKRDVRMAGYGIRHTIDSDSLCVLATDLLVDGEVGNIPDEIFRGHHGIAVFGTEDDDSVYQDQIIINYNDDDDALSDLWIVKEVGAGNLQVSPQAQDLLSVGDIIVASGPTRTIIGEITNISGGTGNNQHLTLVFSSGGGANVPPGQESGNCGVSGMYPDPDSTFFPFDSASFHYRIDSTRDREDGTPVHALFRGNEEIAENVRGLRVEYLEADENAYEWQPGWTDSQDIIAVRLHLLVTSEETRLLEQPSTTWPTPFDQDSSGNPIQRTGDDQTRMAHVYTSTITLRNKTP